MIFLSRSQAQRAGYVVGLGVLLGAGACRTTKRYADRDLEDLSEEVQEGVEPGQVPPYTGDDPFVLDAQARFPTGLEFHQKVIWRTCTPNDGVCHNRKEYPDLHTPLNFLAAFSAPCNLQVGEFASAYDGCERAGDLLQFSNDAGQEGPFEVAWAQFNPGEEDEPASLEFALYGVGSPKRDSFWSQATLRHAQGPSEAYASLTGQWRWSDAGHLRLKLEASVRDAVRDIILPQVIQADLNRNDSAGALDHPASAMLVPGDPQASYLVGRIRGAMWDAPVPGSRMPLANRPLDVAEMLALYCLIEGYDEAFLRSGMAAAIDYRNCSFSDDPGSLNLLGEGVTWDTRIRKIFAAHCGGCHSEARAEAGLDLVSPGAYARLFVPSSQKLELDLIDPGSPEDSYLYQKLIAGDDIVGAGMPIDVDGQHRPLAEAESADILTWIVNGAIEGESR